jgi:septal ring factor EnvC (AmiA/AmiB activator)
MTCRNGHMHTVAPPDSCCDMTRSCGICRSNNGSSFATPFPVAFSPFSPEYPLKKTMDSNIAKIEELMKRVTELEKRNKELQSQLKTQIDNLQSNANQRVKDLHSQIIQLQHDYSQMQFSLTSLENKFRNLSR